MFKPNTFIKFIDTYAYVVNGGVKNSVIPLRYDETYHILPNGKLSNIEEYQPRFECWQWYLAGLECYDVDLSEIRENFEIIDQEDDHSYNDIKIGDFIHFDSKTYYVITNEGAFGAVILVDDSSRDYFLNSPSLYINDYSTMITVLQWSNEITIESKQL